MNMQLASLTFYATLISCTLAKQLMVVTSTDELEDDLEIFDPSLKIWRHVRKQAAEKDGLTDARTALLAKLSNVVTASAMGDMTTRILEKNNVLQYRLKDGMATRLASLEGNEEVLGAAMLEFGNTFCCVGGFKDGMALKTVYCWNPLTNAVGENNTGWIRLPDMRVARYAAAAAVLDGKLYVAGGHDPLQHRQIRDVEVFDDVTQKWYQAADMREARASLRLVSLNGRLYALGGWRSRQFLASAEEYNPQLNLWTSTEQMRVPRANFGAVAVDDNVYVAGGINGFRPEHQLAHVEIFVPANQTWSSIDNSDMHHIRGPARATLVTVS